jgi:hypothetical protein
MVWNSIRAGLIGLGISISPDELAWFGLGLAHIPVAARESSPSPFRV